MNYTKLFFLIAMIIALFACKTEEKDYDNAVLWEITKPGNKHVSYLLGTIHVLDTSQINFPIETFMALIDKCENLCLEAIPYQGNKSQKINEYFFCSDENLKISNRLGEEYYNKLMKIVGASENSLKYFEPYIDSVRPSILNFFILSDKQLIQSEKFKEPNYYPETDFFNYANYKGYKTIPLESNEQQFEWIAEPDLSYEKSIEILKKTIDDFYDKDSEYDIFKEYSEQNLALGDPEEFSDSTMVLRNNGMAEKIAKMIRKKSVFIAIGAAHLPYENGVLNLLVRKGYTVKPCKINLKKK